MAVAPAPDPTNQKIGYDLHELVWRIVQSALSSFRPAREPRIYTMNVPFGTPGIAPTVPQFILPLGVGFPSRPVAWRLWAQPSGTATIDVRLVNPAVSPTAPEVSVVGGALPSVNGVYSESASLSTWTLGDLAAGKLLLFYLVGPTSSQYGVFQLDLLDLSGSSAQT